MKRLNVHQGIPALKQACTCRLEVINYNCGYFLTSRLRKGTVLERLAFIAGQKLWRKHAEIIALGTLQGFHIPG